MEMTIIETLLKAKATFTIAIGDVSSMSMSIISI
jgi:hypothetical protein